MLQDTALRLDQEKSSFWSLDFGEHKDLMEDYLLPNMLMLVRELRLFGPFFKDCAKY